MKTVIVTGANRGLGRALLSAFQEAGWFIIATARRADSIPGGNSVLPLVLDLSRYDSVASCAEQVRASGKTVDLLINNAGYNPKDSKDDGYFRSTFNIEHFSGENVADSLHINALAPVEFASKLLPVMSPEAVIVNIS